MNIYIQKDQSIYSCTDGLKIAYDLYTPDHFNGVIIQIAHGMIEHKERYKNTCETLAQAGYGIIINDHRGHGNSIDAHHPLGEMDGTQNHHAHGFLKAIEDLHQLTLIAKTHFASNRVILIGHSMGSLLSRGYLKKYANEIKALILLGSPAYDPLSPLGIILIKTLRFFQLKSFGERFAHQLILGKFDQAFKQPKATGESFGTLAWLNRDPQAIELYKQDQKCQFRFSLQSCESLLKGLIEVQNISKDSPTPQIPICILSGTDDPCGHFGKGVEKISNLYKEKGFSVYLKLYPKARHELLLELNHAEVLKDIILWIQSLA